MKKIIIFVSLMLLLFTVIIVYSQGPSPTPFKTSNQEQKQPEKYAKDSNVGQSLAKNGTVLVNRNINSTISHPQSDNTTNNTNDDSSLNWWIILATIFIAICAGIQAYAMIRQYYAIKGQDQTSRLRDRAFVYFLNPTFIPYPPNKPIGWWGVAINVENTGNMPARSISIKYAHVVTQKSAHIIDPFSLAKWSNAQVSNVIGPKQSFSLQGGDIPISTIEEAKKNKIDVFILMEAKYIDGFELNKYRVTQMSRSLRFDEYGGQSLGFAGPHNCTDDDCN